MADIDKINTLICKLKTYGHIPAPVEEELQMKIKSISKRKGTLLIQRGQVNKNLFIVVEGLIRSFYQKNGEEVTVWFAYENLLFTTVASLYGNRDAYESVECLEDSVFQYISYDDLNKLYDKYPELNAIGRRFTEEYCILLDERNLAFQALTAEERYRDLVKKEPEIIRRVSLGQIASYLGITQATLSRIRRRK